MPQPKASTYKLGQQKLTPAFASALNQGMVNPSEMAALLQASWELVTQDKSSNDAILFLLGITQGAYEALNESVMILQQMNPTRYQELMGTPIYASADERMAPLAASPAGVYATLLSLSGGFEKTWGQLEADRGPLVLKAGDTEVVFDESPASVISRYVALPLIYGIWPADWEQRMSEYRGEPGVPDATLPIRIFNDRGGNDTQEAKSFMSATLRHMADAMAKPSMYPGFQQMRMRGEMPRLRGDGTPEPAAPSEESSISTVWNEFQRIANEAYNYVAGAIKSIKNRSAIWWGLGLGLGLGVIGFVLLSRRND